jgi:hypothetical protein
VELIVFFLIENDDLRREYDSENGLPSTQGADGDGFLSFGFCENHKGVNPGARKSSTSVTLPR